MRKTLIIGGASLIAMLLVLGACTPQETITATPEPRLREFTRTFYISITEFHIECFSFSEGDEVEGKFVVDGQYTVDLLIIYAETLPGEGKAYDPSNCILETGEVLERSFFFTAPVSSEYAFCFRGFYADKADSSKPFEGLHQSITLYITVNP